MLSAFILRQPVRADAAAAPRRRFRRDGCQIAASSHFAGCRPLRAASYAAAMLSLLSRRRRRALFRSRQPPRRFFSQPLQRAAPRRACRSSERFTFPEPRHLQIRDIAAIVSQPQ